MPVWLPREYIGVRVKVIVVLPEANRDVMVVKPSPCASEEELVDVKRMLERA